MGKIKIEKYDSVKLYKIRKTIEELSKIAGRGTELILSIFLKENNCMK